MAYIIEFSGKPGVGKTLACHELIGKSLAAFPDRRIKGLVSNELGISGPATKALGLVCTAGLRYSRLAVIFHHFNRAMSGHDRIRILKSFWNAVHLDFQLWRAVRKYDIVILDQGFMQLCWANLVKENEEKIKSLLLGLYAPYRDHRILLVHMEAHDEVFEKSLKLRGDLFSNDGYRFDYLNDNELNELVNAVSNKMDCSPVKITNDVAGEINVMKVISSL